MYLPVISSFPSSWRILRPPKNPHRPVLLPGLGVSFTRLNKSCVKSCRFPSPHPVLYTCIFYYTEVVLEFVLVIRDLSQSEHKPQKNKTAWDLTIYSI
ncbi:hypothetical protein EYC80_005701 [Monilinia laxa]|uniref:Uncharacterized protein n=1 Tax=Monilinia laxa TaxID=61186 RepID=A0A5N6KEQ1_MONLA|nr:hypothetical protein EYC80_005701 [Monilinia laxa]